MNRLTFTGSALVAVALAVPSVGVAAKPPASTVSLAAAPNPIVFGRAVTLSGAIKGGTVAGRTVTLEADPYPIDGTFKPVATGTTTSTGAYTFTQKPGLNTQYRVVAKTKPPATSPSVLVRVRSALSLYVSDSTPKKGQVVRFSGRARPAHNGAIVAIQRRTSTGFRTVARTRLVANDAASSKYSRRLRIYRSGTFRVVLAADADHAAGVSRRRTLRVHR